MIPSQSIIRVVERIYKLKKFISFYGRGVTLEHDKFDKELEYLVNELRDIVRSEDTITCRLCSLCGKIGEGEKIKVMYGLKSKTNIVYCCDCFDKQFPMGFVGLGL